MAVVLPRLGNSKNSSTKDQIIYLLSQEWPLTAKQIFNRILKEKSSAISYQAIHKTLKELFEGNVLEKQAKGYCLDSNWISQIKDFGLQLEKAYSDGKNVGLKKLVEQDSVNLFFETPFGVAKFLILEFYSLPNPQKIGVINARHCYPSVGFSLNEVVTLFHNSLQNKWLVLVKTDTITDNLLSNQYKKLGYKFKFGVDCVNDCDLFIIGDYICQIYWSEKALDYWKKLLRKTETIKDFNLKDWFDFMYNKWGEIQIIVNKNPTVAERIRQKTLKYFKSDKKGA